MRKSGIELLRILSLFAVIMMHYWEQASKYAIGLNFHSFMFLRSLSASAVDVFILISGYFLCTTQKRTLGKPINLIIQVSLINFIAYIIKSYYGLEPSISIRHITSSLLPDSYYTTLFVVLYIISPYINNVISQLTRRGWKVMIILLVSIFSLYQTAFDLFSEVIGKEMMGLSPIGAWGGQKGFNIVNFTLLYVVGAYLKYNSVTLKKRKLIWGILFCVSTIFIWGELDLIIRKMPLNSSWVYHNPIVILQAVLLFLYFKGLSLSSFFINRAAKSVYTCFLAHCQIMVLVGIEYYARMPLLYMIVHYLIVSIVCFFVSWVLWFLYDQITRSLFRKLDRIELTTYYK